jgi:hypothetical protein
MRRIGVHSVIVVAAVVVTASGAILAQGNDPFYGTWKLNVAKSTYDPGPPPMSVTRIVEPWENDGIKETAIVVQADGTRITGELTAHFDGKDYKSANPNFDMAAFKREAANTFTSTMKRGGQVVATVKYVVSENGKVATETLTGTNRKGQQVHNVTVYEKQ